MLLIHPPIAKPSEPPAGIARLSGALGGHGINHAVLDANLEGLLYVLNHGSPPAGIRSDRWTERAYRNASRNLAALRAWRTYDNMDRYKRAVIDLNHAVEMTSVNGALAGLADYRHHSLSPLRSSDLIRSAERPEDNPFYPYFSKRLSGVLKKNGPRTVGLSLNYLSQALCTFAMIGFLRRDFPDAHIILGGGLITSWMRNPGWRNPFIGLVDQCIAGPGERQLLFIAGMNEDGEEHYTPRYDAFLLNNYLSPGRILPYSASVGCYWNKCSFCPEEAEDTPYVPVPVNTVMDDLNSLIIKTNPRLVHLLDNSVGAALLKKLADDRLGVPWYGFARISKLLTDMDFCLALKESGCVMLKLGLESGDQRVLDGMQKGIDLETASSVLRTLKKAGVASYVYLLFGTPPESLSEARNTLEFVVRHNSEICFLNVAVFNMPVCGKGVSGFDTRGFYEADLSLYTDFAHPKGWDRKKVRAFLDHEFRRHGAVSEILRKGPPVFTSNHAPFFIMAR